MMIVIIIGIVVAIFLVDRLIFPWHYTNDLYKHNIFGRNHFGRTRKQQEKKNAEFRKKFYGGTK